MGSSHRFSFLMQHCKNHKFAHQLTCYCPAWTVDFDLNSVSKCVCFRGSVININLSAEVSKALYQKLILLSAKPLTRNTRPKCSPRIPSSSSQTHTQAQTPHHKLNAARTLKHTLFLTSLQNQYCWKWLRLEVFKLSRLSCPKTNHRHQRKTSLKQELLLLNFCKTCFTVSWEDFKPDQSFPSGQGGQPPLLLLMPPFFTQWHHQ